MSLKSRYNPVELIRQVDGGFTAIGGDTIVQTFQGLIQTPSNSNAFSNGKDTSNTTGVLFTDVSMNAVLQEGDKVRYIGGEEFIVNGAGSQPKGVTGIKSHHAEFTLVFANGS